MLELKVKPLIIFVWLGYYCGVFAQPPPPLPPPRNHLPSPLLTPHQELLREITNTVEDNIPIDERQFRVVYEWSTFDFAFPNDYERGRARRRGDFIEKNVIISDVKAFAQRLYVTMPRLLPGVPATLGYVIAPDNNGRTDPLIEPFPSWELNRVGDCRALQFVQGIEIDDEGYLWAVDTGRSSTLATDQPLRFCPPKLVIIDLKRNASIHHVYEFPNDVVGHGTNFLSRIVVDDGPSGFVYITDSSGHDPGIVVYSRRANLAWKLREPNSMRAAAEAIDFAINGTRLRFSIHINGLALGPHYTPPGSTKVERNLYYSPLSSYHLYSVPTSILRDPEFSLRSTPAQTFESVTDYGIKLSQTDGMIMDNRGILYYGLLKENAICRWDSYEPFTIENQQILAKDDNYIQWPDGMSLDENGYLYVVVNRLYNFVAGRLNPNEVNFRILRAKTGAMSYTFLNPPTAINPESIVPSYDGSILPFRSIRRPYFYNNSNKLHRSLSLEFILFLSCTFLYRFLL